MAIQDPYPPTAEPQWWEVRPTVEVTFSDGRVFQFPIFEYRFQGDNRDPEAVQAELDALTSATIEIKATAVQVWYGFATMTPTEEGE